MRILGLIAGYAVALFLTGWLLLDVESKSGVEKFLDSSNEARRKARLFVDDKNSSEQSDEASGFWQGWLHRPIGVVRYPDFPPINFLKNGD